MSISDRLVRHISEAVLSSGASVGANRPTERPSGRDQKTESGVNRYRLQLTRDEASRARARQLDGGYRERAARAFYEGALGGRQVWPTGPRAAARGLWFMVGSTILRVSLVDSEIDAPELQVDSPSAIAERCWDAGYTVRVKGEDSDDLIVLDPFGRELVLTPRPSAGSLGAEAG